MVLAIISLKLHLNFKKEIFFCCKPQTTKTTFENKTMASFTLPHIFGVILVCLLCGTIQQSHAATEYSRYLAHIFQKYGTGGTISFEVSSKILVFF